MNSEQRQEIFRRFRDANPTPTTELIYSSPFELLIAVVLSAQATDVAVNKATQPLFAVANTPLAMLELGEAKLKGAIKSIGLYNTKARNIIATCQLLLDRHEGEIPKRRAGLEQLPGVGRKTANVILNSLYGQPTIAVDTHIFRVANRTGLATGRTPLKVEQSLLQNVPSEFKLHAHHWLILHGRYTCTAKQPKCRDCIIVDLCEFEQKVGS